MSVPATQPPVTQLRARPMRPEDIDLRTRAYLANINRFGAQYSAEDIAQAPYSEYLSFVPDRGDIGIVLYDAEDQVVGTMWVTFIKGLGYVADNVPEMVLNVDPTWQGRGVGSWLIQEATAHGRHHGWPGITLNVEKQSPARKLYARHDFVTQTHSTDDSSIMLKALAPEIRSVAVYCDSAHGARDEFTRAARALGAGLADRGVKMVFGGGSVGLMGETANACLAAGGRVHGVMPKTLVDLELSHPDLSELDITETMAERKTRMEELADAFVALPGGMGTLEELFEVLVRQQLGPHTGPVGLLNTEEFWDPLLTALRSMADEGFIPARYLDAIVVAENVDDLFDGFQRWASPGLKW
ncbi:TIGR00730 family Rossman fold protein [Corynebacterium gerontici]|nr:TIGR00730 family Rossman fold protein [Corynebacterium gerontici]